MKRRHLLQGLAGLVLFRGQAVWAAIPNGYQQVAQAQQVPVQLLYAIALTESGMAYQNTARPWPWALNIAGRGVYCASQDEARQRIFTALATQQAIDIGLMQISLYWHRQRFQHVTEALEPFTNLNVGAMILREQVEQSGDWWHAVGAYHDPGTDTQSREAAARYRRKVITHWERL